MRGEPSRKQSMYRLSKARVPGLCLVALMALFARSVSAVTASQEAVRDETCQQLEQRLDAGQAPSVVITTLTESGHEPGRCHCLRHALYR